MGWTGIKKALDRAGTQVMMKVGNVEKTVDREFETQERRFRQVEAASGQLQKNAKGYLDSLRALTSAQLKIAETIDVFYGDSGQRDNLSKQYLTAVTEIDTQTIKQLDEPYRVTVLEPITRFNAYHAEANAAITKRNHKALDYDKFRAKTRKLVDKPSNDASKLPMAQREEQNAKEIYEDLNNQLIDELPQLVDARVPYLDPSFEALVNIQLQFCTESYSRLAEVQQYMDPTIRDEYSNGQLDAKIEQSIAAMRELTIASM